MILPDEDEQLIGKNIYRSQSTINEFDNAQDTQAISETQNNSESSVCAESGVSPGEGAGCSGVSSGVDGGCSAGCGAGM